jgi:hypothetical protein
MKKCLEDQGSFEGGFFCVVSALGKILTIDNLQKRHVILVDWCVMCKKNGESVAPLLLHCGIDCAIWIVFFKRFGLPWVMPTRVVNLFASW